MSQTEKSLMKNRKFDHINENGIRLRKLTRLRSITYVATACFTFYSTSQENRWHTCKQSIQSMTTLIVQIKAAMNQCYNKQNISEW